MGIGNDQIAARWRPHIVEKLQDLYGLREEEARIKAEVWLQWIEVQSVPAVRLVPSSERQNQGIQYSKSRTAAATGL
jgi:hypothetical protein